MDTNRNQDSESSSKTLIILLVTFLLVIVGVVVAIILLKPQKKSFNNEINSVKNTPKEHIEALDPKLSEIYGLSHELWLFDELFNELVYAEEPDVNVIGSFVNSYKNLGEFYVKDQKPLTSPYTTPVKGDTTTISFDLQFNYVKGSIERLLESIGKKQKVFMTIPVTFPMKKELVRIVSGFGMRDHPILEKRMMHNGIDIGAPVGTEVVATAVGKVIRTEEKPGYGRNCLIEHKFGYQTLYGHMVRMIVGEGKMLQKGEVIGYVGNTGLSEAAHLHYEVRKNGKPMNPSYFLFEGLTPEEYKEAIIQGSKKNEILSF